MPPPTTLRPYLSFRRLTGPALDAARRALDDEPFRERVRVVAEGSGVLEDAADARAEEAMRLVLERPEGWEAALGVLVADAGASAAEEDARARLEAVERELGRARTEREAAERLAERAGQGRQRAEADAEALRRAAGQLSSELEAARAESERLGDERQRAVRDLKAVEARLADRLAELRALRGDLEAAQARIAELEAAGPASASASADGRGSADRDGPAPGAAGPGREEAGTATAPEGSDAGPAPGRGAPVDPFPERGRVADAVGRAAEAAGALTRALAEAAEALGRGIERSGPADGEASGRPGAESGASRGPGVAGGAPRPRRRPPRLPVGMFDDTADAAEHLVRLPGAVLLVDGYNVSLGRWPGLPLPEQRERLVGALDLLAARTGCEVVVVFDGADEGAGRPAGSRLRGVQVRFTPDDVEADDEVLALVGRYPLDRPVVVASSDRRVADGALAGGAATVSSLQLTGLLDGLNR